jgi:hypothetical protein
MSTFFSEKSTQAWGYAVKAHGADAAYQAASELALLVGAAGFTTDSRTAKTRGDLNALLYADGIHDSLYRAVGRDITGSTRAVTLEVAVPLVPAMRKGRDEELARLTPGGEPLPEPGNSLPRWTANCLTARGSSGRRTATACPVLQDDRQAAGLPFSSAATVPTATASRHDATRRASNGVTSPATSSRATNANLASSPSASTISLISASGSTPPS